MTMDELDMDNVVLINPPSNCVEDDRLEPQLGLLYIAAVLKENNIPVQIYDMIPIVIYIWRVKMKEKKWKAKK